MQNRIHGLGWVLTAGLLAAVACGGGDDDDVVPADDAGAVEAGSSGAGGSSGGSSGADGGSSGALDAGPPMLTSVPFRLGLIQNISGSNVTWTLRLYGTGGYLQGDVLRRCGVPEVHEGCLLERCVEDTGGAPDGSTATPWTGFVNLVDETQALTLRVDLAALGQTTDYALVAPLEVQQIAAGDVLHLTTENVTGFPAVDVRLQVPAGASLTLPSPSLSVSQGNPFTSPAAAGLLRVDVLTTGGAEQVAASCFFDRAATDHTFPALGVLGFPACAGPLTLLPIGASREILTAPGGAQILAYVVAGDAASYQQGLACVP